jgi:hypothetical protein
VPCPPYITFGPHHHQNDTNSNSNSNSNSHSNSNSTRRLQAELDDKRRADTPATRRLVPYYHTNTTASMPIYLRLTSLVLICLRYTTSNTTASMPIPLRLTRPRADMPTNPITCSCRYAYELTSLVPICLRYLTSNMTASMPIYLRTDKTSRRYACEPTPLLAPYCPHD